MLVLRPAFVPSDAAGNGQTGFLRSEQRVRNALRHAQVAFVVFDPVKLQLDRQALDIAVDVPHQAGFFRRSRRRAVVDRGRKRLLRFWSAGLLTVVVPAFLERRIVNPIVEALVV